MIEAIDQLVPGDVAAACRATGVPRATYYRQRPSRRPAPPSAEPARSAPARKLSAEERQRVLGHLHSERFVDKSPAEVFATLLDEGEYLCSERTMYRILAEYEEVRERRNQLRHPEYKKPELLATGPNQVWSWDITKLRGPQKWSYFYLYVVLDIFSRYVVAWIVAHRETGALSKRLLHEAYERHGVQPDELTIHADRGTQMTGKQVAQLLADLGVTRSHSRPHTSDDNPFSGAQFKTLKYSPAFPGRFGSLEDAKSFCRPFFHWYNNDHRHGGIGLLTPADVHFGRAAAVTAYRAEVLRRAYEQHPERFVSGPPSPPRQPQEVWINPPPVARGDQKEDGRTR